MGHGAMKRVIFICAVLLTIHSGQVWASSPDYLKQAKDRLKLARKTLAFVQKTVLRPEMAKELKGLEERFAALGAVASDSAPAKELFDCHQLGTRISMNVVWDRI